MPGAPRRRGVVRRVPAPTGGRRRVRVLRFLLWRMLGLLAVLLGAAVTSWLLSGGPGKTLRGGHTGSFDPSLSGLAHLLAEPAIALRRRLPLLSVDSKLLLAFSIVLIGGLLLARM